MRRRALPILVLAILLPTCVADGPRPNPTPGATAPPSLLTRTVDENAGPSVFPPEDGHHADRPPPGDGPTNSLVVPNAARAPRVVSPWVDNDEPIDLTTGRIRLQFDDTMERPAGPAKGPIEAAPGTLVIAPEVKGRSLWTDAYHLELVPDKPLAIGERYTVTLGDVRSAAGGKPESQWHMTVIPRVEIAGKILSHAPKAGEPRVVAIHPHDSSTVGPRPEIAVLYDQPVEPARALGLVHLVPKGGAPVPLSVAHPLGPTFQGIEVDRRFVIVVKPAVSLERGTKYRLEVDAAYPGGERASRPFEVAGPLQITGVDCPYGGNGCSADGTTIDTSGTEMGILVNNRISLGAKELVKLVRVTPPVERLEAYMLRGDMLIVNGAFERSTTYDVALVGLVDHYGSRLEKPFHATFTRGPEDASLTMPSGVLLLDDEGMKRFAITTRNVAEAVLSFWPVEEEGLAAAVHTARDGRPPGEASRMEQAVEVHGNENALVTTTVDLTKALFPGKRYLVTARVAKTAYGAEAPFGVGIRPVALVSPAGAQHLAVHVEKRAAQTLVHVARLGTGEPVGDAHVTLLRAPDAAMATTGADGLALFGGGEDDGWLDVTAAGSRTLVDLHRPDVTAEALFPRFADGTRDDDAATTRAVLFTDRGIYRPGSTVHLFANVRRPEGDALAAMSETPMVVRALGPSGDEVFRAPITTDDTGSLAASFDLAKGAKLGRHRVVVQPVNDEKAEIAEAIVQVAEFEPPRFTVDVDAAASDAKTLRASVRARYLFGAPMDGAVVTWTARREPAAINEGPFTGFAFRPARDSWDDRPRAAKWSRAGTLGADADGLARVDQPISLDGSDGPQRFVIEAEATDASHRVIAGRATTIVHPAERYAGLRVARRWTSTHDPFSVELGVVDREGKPVEGVPVSAVLREITYTRIARRDAGGALSYDWTRTSIPAARCAATSAAKAVRCELSPKNAGDFEIAAEIDGRTGGAANVWAWDGPGSSGPEIPSRGRAIEIVPDKPSYAPGDTAKLFITSPFAAATAIVTTDAADAKPRAIRIDGSAAVIDVPISAADAPHLHAMVTLLPLAAKNAAPDFRIGAVRLPVAMNAARLALEVTPSKASYGPGDEAEIALRVADGNSPSQGARLAIAVVDEGVLRFTGFHAPDPVEDMRPGRALHAEITDTRAMLADLVARSHVAGDGDEGGTPSTRDRHGDTEKSVTNARRSFAETAFWKPDVRTDAEGRAVVRFKLPDNLTQFRVMAIALDRAGKGAVAETSFHVTKPVLLAPALPRFVSLGDTFEAAALVHSTAHGDGSPSSAGKSGDSAPGDGSPSSAGKSGEAAQTLTVSLGDHDQQVRLPAGGHARVAFRVRVACEGDPWAGEILACPTAEPGERPALHLSFAVHAEDGATLDSVEQRVPATVAGLDETPRTDGTFTKSRTITLRVPAHVTAADGHDALVVTLGAQMWPELGERLRYLLDYPHGCVEQTTSSTLPLLAARDIAPRIGLDAVNDADLRKKIRAGLDRLATMRTSSGGLGYWPNDPVPNPYGTAYAMRALVLAKAAGIDAPDGLLDGMASYLQGHMLAAETPPEVAAAIAQSLAELGRLDPGASDALFDRLDKQTVFGSASLAIALSWLPGQDDRVERLLDRVEEGVDDNGNLREAPRSDDFHYYGSPARTKAQAAIALRKLRPASPKLPLLVHDLAATTQRYTTQATAYSLLALAEELRRLSPDASDTHVFVDGREIEGAAALSGAGRRFEIPLADLAGREARLELRSDAAQAIGFSLRASWRRPAIEASPKPFCTDRGPAVYRAFSTPKGKPVDLASVRAGDVLRVALLVRRPRDVDPTRFGYIAITDRLPAGFEPVQQDLATTATQSDLALAAPDDDDDDNDDDGNNAAAKGSSAAPHPFAAWFRNAGRPSFVELHDERVNIYFDQAQGDDVIASYLVRATTPGAFSVAPATAELMYEPDSLGATEPDKVIVR